jgi:UDP-2,4-diacetamido-2,4,6-trideoxy-beta-L-altropyranose hydrolase
MANKKIILRVDGNSNMGLGHIYRGIALAEMLKDEFEVLFVKATAKDQS